MQTTKTNIPNTPAEAVALFNKGAKVLGKPKTTVRKKKVGVSKRFLSQAAQNIH